MQEPKQFDVIELLVDLPEQSLKAGTQGAIVELYDDACEVEFTDDAGETLALVPLQSMQFVVVWRAASKSWVSVAEKVEALVAALPEEALAEVFVFARSAYSRQMAG
ncbi:MAG: DUF4926 domain-containing protein [Cyanobacteria bacterium P01_C01_bin.118]